MEKKAELTELTICSFNSRGHGLDRRLYLKKLLNSCDIVFVQEHWYFDDDICKIVDQIDDVNVIGISAMESRQLLVGRPHGGCAILYRRSLSCTFTPIASKSRRVCAIMMQLNAHTRILLICIYMPCDTSNDHSNLQTFMEVLSEMEYIMDTTDYDHVIVGGDFNTDFSRSSTSLHNAPLNEFNDRQCLHSGLNSSMACVDFTYHNDFTGSKSIVDHFFLSELLFLSINEYRSLDDGDNLSDHSPLLLKLSIPVVATQSLLKSEFHKKASWNRATENDLNRYRSALRERLTTLEVPHHVMQCNELCRAHDAEIEQYHNNIIEICLESADRAIPKCRKRAKAAWLELVKPSQNEAIFWNKIWVSNGRPRTGWVSEIRNKTRREYRRISRWVIRNQDDLRAEKMANSLSNNRHRDMWGEVKRVNRNGSSLPNVVDGVQGESEVCQLFGRKYSDLYNSVGFDEVEMRELDAKVQSLCRDTCSTGRCYCSHVVGVGDVASAVRKLKRSKSDSLPLLSSDHFINAPHDLMIHLSLLLTMMLKHSYVPTKMLQSVLVPIPKNVKKSLADSNNYRSIAISSVLGKLLDNIVIAKNGHILSGSNLQFGFRANHSTTQCTFVLQEIINFYANRGSSVYVTLLDASRAFDRVNYVRLFSLLLKRGMCGLTIRLLLNSYVCQSMFVRWCNITSTSFACVNGVKQGGVLSPILFSVYMDELLCRLSRLGVGCHLHGEFVGGLCYADDMTLIAPSYSASKQLLSVCESFSREYDVMFNSTKSHVLVFNSLNVTTRAKLSLNGAPIEYVDHALHLGTYIGVEDSALNIRKAQGDIYARVNLLHSRFHYCSYDVLRTLFVSYCTSYYGCPLWDLREHNIEPLSIAWRKGVRRLFDLHNQTHSRFIPRLIGLPNINTVLISRFAQFFSHCFFSPNSVVANCARLALNSGSVVNNNVNILCSLLNCNHSTLCSIVQNNLRVSTYVIARCLNSLSEEDESTCQCIIELLKMKKREMISVLDEAEINVMLNNLCIM